MEVGTKIVEKPVINDKILDEVTVATQLHINERLFKKGLITEEMYMKAKEIFLKT